MIRKKFDYWGILYVFLILTNAVALGVLAWIYVPLYFEDMSSFSVMRKVMVGENVLCFVILPLFLLDIFCYCIYYFKKHNYHFIVGIKN